MGPSVVIMILLQLFNWFSKKTIGLVYGLIYFFKYCGYYICVNNDNVGAGYIGSGVAILVFAIVDWVTFCFYPMQAGFFVEV